ncbi:BTAD domain-containing putative transcriptional regulator [Streptomyces sp. NPDC049910]|uniref:BTAD domain-containing putative transcriptional regulator n=1 Tax=Streptomyces sp. NPDC049910 TaxID=3155278 RepID=UPI003422CD86
MNHPLALRQRLTAAATAGATLAVTLALLAGMPYILWRAAGVPWPERIYTLSEFIDRLAEPVSDPLLIEILSLVGWVCWAAFTCTVVREALWYTAHLPQLLRDRRAHDEHLAAVSVKGSLAALCVGTLVVALIGLWRPPTAAAQHTAVPGELRAYIAATAPLVPALDRQPAHAEVATTTHLDSGPTRPGPVQARALAEAVDHVEYTVVEGDTLWDIADRHLGDSLKWPRIYKLNKDRLQNDGARLADPDRIRPGWQLTIPVPQPAAPPPALAPAPTGAEPETRPAPPAESVPAQQAPSPEPGAQQQLAEHTDRQQRAEEPPQAATHNKGPAAIGLGEASLIGITTAAGLLAARRYWYWHQSRRQEPSPDEEIPALSPLVDKAAQAAQAATQPRDPHTAEALITRRTPPQPPGPVDTITIGVRDDTEVPISELALPGGCTWDGPGAESAARALLVGILTAAERQRPRAPRVTAVVPEDLADRLVPGLPPQFTALTQEADTEQAIQAAERHLVAHAHAQEEREDDLVDSETRARVASEQASPGTLLLLTTPEAAHTGQLQTLAARSRSGTLIVLTLHAPLPGAETWHITADGTAVPASGEQHPTPLRLFHLTPEAGRDVTEVLLTAHGQRPRPRLRALPPASLPPHSHPRETETETETEPESDAEPEPNPENDPPGTHPTGLHRAAQTKPIRLQVLGPVTLYARGTPDPIGTQMRPEAHEFLALLAAHPTGLLASDIAEKLHLEPGTEQNALKNLRRAVRRTLRAATGITAQEFILLQGEFHKLNHDLVETDLTEFDRKLKREFAKPEEEVDALAAVCEAAGLYRGPFAQGSDYLWSDSIREHLAMKICDAVLRLARKAERAGSAEGGRHRILHLLEHLSAIHPDHERLAQHAIRLYQGAGRHDAARHAYNRLTRQLAELGFEPEPATQALITPLAGARQKR